ncbi:MAG: hypothetical protein GC159_04325 [Phycisphaera sp.]|nr:hypothetical protein [Phycisphaera sp.]
MLIDWFTVVAQAINFLILVVLLKVFLFDRVVKAMDQRERDIAARIDDAEQRKRTAEGMVTDAEAKNRRFESERQSMIADARGEADRLRDEWTREARKQVDQLKRRWSESVSHQHDEFLRELRQRVGQQTVDIARQALRDLADADLQARMTETFARRLDTLDEATRAKIAAKVGEASGTLDVHTSFELSDDQRRAITDVVHRVLASDRELRFDIDDAMICGVELRVDGFAIGWNLDAYLDTLTESIGQSLSNATETSTVHA